MALAYVAQAIAVGL